MPVFYLNLRASLHQGEFLGVERQASLDRVPSDTLFAALVVAWQQSGADLEQSLQGFAPGETPPFILTSAFPRAGNVCFYPVPPLLPARAGFHPGDKAAKKLRWMSGGVLHQLQNGQAPERQEDCFLHGKTTWLTPEERLELAPLFQADELGRPGLWGRQVTPHVTVDRQGSASNLFYSGEVVFAESCGLWFAARGEAHRVSAALEVLQESGLGGLRSTGHGAFTYRQINEELPAAHGDWGYSLSRWAPRKQEVHLLKRPGVCYAFETVGGWFQDDNLHAWRRRTVRMVAEGALLPGQGVQGDTVDVRPQDERCNQRPVYRLGQAFLVPAQKLVEVK